MGVQNSKPAVRTPSCSGSGKSRSVKGIFGSSLMKFCGLGVRDSTEKRRPDTCKLLRDGFKLTQSRRGTYRTRQNRYQTTARFYRRKLHERF